ncbi:MAG: hypothetical protein ABI355_14575 [Solirubrobacteraceae bacterium]
MFQLSCDSDSAIKLGFRIHNRRAEARSTPRPRPRLSSRLLRREELAATAFGNADLASSGTPVGLVEPCFAWVMAVAVGRATEWVGKRGRSYARSMLDDL